MKWRGDQADYGWYKRISTGNRSYRQAWTRDYLWPPQTYCQPLTVSSHLCLSGYGTYRAVSSPLSSINRLKGWTLCRFSGFLSAPNQAYRLYISFRPSQEPPSWLTQSEDPHPWTSLLDPWNRGLPVGLLVLHRQRSCNQLDHALKTDAHCHAEFCNP